MMASSKFAREYATTLSKDWPLFSRFVEFHKIALGTVEPEVFANRCTCTFANINYEFFNIVIPTVSCIMGLLVHEVYVEMATDIGKLPIFTDYR